jgi:hypothetical protein
MTGTMVETIGKVEIESIFIKEIECIRFTFNGLLTNKDAIKATEIWSEMFALRKNKKVLLIFNCLNMKDYEPLARATWQKTLSLLKPQIGGIWVVSNSKLITAGATIMGVFTSFSIKTVDSEEKILL